MEKVSIDTKQLFLMVSAAQPLQDGSLRVLVWPRESQL